MKFIRWILRILITAIDYIMQPKFFERPYSQQQELDQRTSSLSIYQFKACPFCVKVRWALQKRGLRVKYQDAKNHEPSKQELLSGGGKIQVPCLRIKQADGSHSWIYESDEIIAYFDKEVLKDSDYLCPQGKVVKT
ncbi:MAG: glutaredoxin family protein [Oligoflexales bacterium]